MSTLKVTNIESPSGGGISAKITDIGGGQLSNRNLIINGAMTIDQRNDGASASFGSYGYVLDRWNQAKNTGSAGTVQQSSEAPVGFKNSVLITNNATGASPSAADQNRFQTRIEGYNVAHLEFGTANAKTITLSFWVRSSLTGTYGIGFSNSAFDRSYVKTYSISSADTWEQKTITLTGDTTGTWLSGTGTGLVVTFDLGSGTDTEGTENAWQADTKYRTSSCVNWIGTGSATFYITGVQLELGDTATSFEHRSYGDELARCQRYFQVFAEGFMMAGTSNGSTQISNVGVPLTTSMRAAPTANSVSYVCWHSNVGGKGATATMTLTATNPSYAGYRGNISGFTGLTDDRVAVVRPSPALELSAEL